MMVGFATWMCVAVRFSVERSGFYERLTSLLLTLPCTPLAELFRAEEYPLWTCGWGSRVRAHQLGQGESFARHRVSPLYTHPILLFRAN